MTTPLMRVRTIAASTLAAGCLAILDEVASRGETVIVTKRGKPVARISPIDVRDAADPRGSALRERDIVSFSDVLRRLGV